MATPFVVAQPIRDLNLSKATVFGTLLTFTVVLPLRLDGAITSSYWAVFTPLWVLYGCIFVGSILATIHWKRHGGSQADRRNYWAVMGVTGLMSLAFMSTVMACANAAGTSLIDWRFVFTPLYIVPFPAFALSMLYRYMNPPRVDADLLIEDFWTLSFFPSLFISLRMAGVTTWAWRVVFVPFWIAYVLLFVAFVAALVKTVVVYWNRRETWQTRVYWTVATLTFLMLVVPTFVFMILLTLKLDGASTASWSTVLAPLNLTLAFAFWLALIRSGGNPYWTAHVLHGDTRLARWIGSIGTVSYTAPPAPDIRPPDLQLHIGLRPGQVVGAPTADLAPTADNVVPPKPPSLLLPL